MTAPLETLDYEAALAENRAFDGDVYSVLEATEDGATGIWLGSDGMLDEARCEQMIGHCIARGWVETDVIYDAHTDREASGWVATESGLAELDRMRDEGEATEAAS